MGRCDRATDIRISVPRQAYRVLLFTPVLVSKHTELGPLPSLTQAFEALLERKAGTFCRTAMNVMSGAELHITT